MTFLRTKRVRPSDACLMYAQTPLVEKGKSPNSLSKANHMMTFAYSNYFVNFSAGFARLYRADGPIRDLICLKTHDHQRLGIRR